MFSIASEIKTIPSWFIGFDIKKLYRHPVKSVQLLIYLLQAGTVIGLFVCFWGILYLRGAEAFLSMPILVTYPLLGTLYAQLIILGVQSRSKLAWLMLAAGGLQYLFTFLFPIGLIVLWLIDRDDTRDYFNRGGVQ